MAQAILLVDYFGSHPSKDWGDCDRNKFLFSHVKSEENESVIFVPQLDAVRIWRAGNIILINSGSLLVINYLFLEEVARRSTLNWWEKYQVIIVLS